MILENTKMENEIVHGEGIWKQIKCAPKPKRLPRKLKKRMKRYSWINEFWFGTRFGKYPTRRENPLKQ